jgi:flagellar protein FliL
MAETSKTSEEEPASAAPVKKKKGKLVWLITLIIVLAAGGAGGYFFLSRNAAKAKAASQKGKKKEPPPSPGEDEPAEDQSDDKGKKGQDNHKADQLAAMLPEDEEVKRVIEVPPFVLNLADPEESRFLRLTLSIGVADANGEKTDPVYLTRVRNAVLAVLMTKSSTDILSVKGKTTLRKELLDAIQAAAKEPPVQAVYITEMLVQR